MPILIWIICGVIAGWLTGMLVSGGGYGLIGDLVVGLIGGIIGGWVFGLIGIAPQSLIGQIIMACAGGVILVLGLRALRRA